MGSRTAAGVQGVHAATALIPRKLRWIGKLTRRRSVAPSNMEGQRAWRLPAESALERLAVDIRLVEHSRSAFADREQNISVEPVGVDLGASLRDCAREHPLPRSAPLAIARPPGPHSHLGPV